MAVKWNKTAYAGVRYREHATRKVAVGVVKYPDKYFAIRYQKDGQRVEEGLGWTSDPEAWTAEKAFAKLTALKEAAKNSLDAPKRLKDERERNAEAERAREEAKRLNEEEKKRREVENITVERFFTDTYLPTVKTHRKNPEKIHDEAHFRLWLAPVIGSKPIKDVSAFDMERVKKNMLAEDRAPRSIQYVFATFRQVWNMARRDKIVSGDSPTRGVKLPKVDNRRDRYLTRKDADALLKELTRRDMTTYRMAALSIYTGMRAAELFRLTWRDVDRVKEHIRIADPKNSESRYAYITGPVKDIIDGMTEGKPDELLFLRPKGTPYHEAPPAYSDAVTALGLNDGVTDRRLRVCFHTLRHTFGSWLAESGVDLYTIGKLMGHKTPGMTSRYVHLGPETLRNAARMLETVPAHTEEGATTQEQK